MIRVVFLSLFLLASCSQAATHVYQVREVDGANGKFHDKRAVSYEEFITAFRLYPWAEQVDLSEALGKESKDAADTIPGPAIKVTDTASDGASLFISAIGNAQAYGYVVGIIYPREFFIEPGGALTEPSETDIKTETVRWAEVFVVKPAALVERYAQKFFAGDSLTLLEYMRKAPPFVSGEASEIANLEE